MTVTYRDIKLKQDKKFESKQSKRNQFRAVVVDDQGNQSGNGSIWADRSTRRVWIMPIGGVQPFQVLCVRITPVIGLGVICGYADYFSNQIEILRTDYEFLGPSNSTGTAYESPSNEDFLPGGRLQLWIDGRMIQPLATYPQSGLIVRVVGGDYPYRGVRKTFPGGAKDLTSSVPGTPGDYRFVGLYLDSSNTLQSVNGTESASAIPAEPAWPSGAFRLSMILLTNGQSSIDIADDIINERMFSSDIDSFTGNVWPLAGKANIQNVEYASIALANAAATTGDLIRLGSGSFALAANFTLTTEVDLAGSGRGVSIVNCDTYSFDADSSYLQDILFSASSGAITFTNCFLTNIGIDGTGDVTISGEYVAGGYFEGDVTLADGVFLNLPRIDGTVTGTYGVDWTGRYIDSTGQIIPAATTTGIETIVRQEVLYSNSSFSTSLVTLPADSTVIKAVVIIRTTFNASSPTMNLGISADTDKYFTTTQLDLATQRLYTVDLYENDSSTDVILEFNPGTGGSQGAADVFVHYTTF